LTDGFRRPAGILLKSKQQVNTLAGRVEGDSQSAAIEQNEEAGNNAADNIHTGDGTSELSLDLIHHRPAEYTHQAGSDHEEDCDDANNDTDDLIDRTDKPQDLKFLFHHVFSFSIICLESEPLRHSRVGCVPTTLMGFHVYRFRV
jgi:hypothetical protein